MGLWWRLFDRLAGHPLEEAEAMELVLAQLARGRPLEEALALGARAMHGLAASTGSADAGRLAIRLAAWEAEATARSQRTRLPEDAGAEALLDESSAAIPEPWQGLIEGWDALREPAVLSRHGAALAHFLRTRRRVALDIASLWAAVLPGVLFFAMGALTLIALGTGGAGGMAGTFGLAGQPIAEAPGASLVLPLAATGLGLLACWILHRRQTHHARGSLARADETALLFFVGAAVESGWPMSRALRGASRLASTPAGGGVFLLRMASALERSTPLPDPGERDSAYRVLVHLSALARQSALDGEAVSTAAAGLSDRRFARRSGVLPWGALGATLPVLGLLVPAYIAALGGPTGDFWERRVSAIFRAAEALSASGARRP